MTSSYTPTENAQGNQVWKPSVGITFKPDKDLAQSYGGIVASLKEGLVNNTGAAKAYPHNYAGIIAAIHDLEISLNEATVNPGPIPPGTEIDINTGDLIVVVPPQDGTLWFDTRQGRLFIAIDNEWWQTNGSDGLAYIRGTNNPPPPSDIAPGQFWFEPVNANLYIFNGIDWVLASSASGLQTTSTLPLATRVDSDNPFSASIFAPPYTDGFDPDKNPVNISNPVERVMDTQEDYNEWILNSFWKLDQATKNYIKNISFEPQAPADPKPGDLWFDPNDVSMFIYYDDDDTAQWVPVHNESDITLALSNLESKINDDVFRLSESIDNLKSTQDSIEQSIAPLESLVDDVAALQSKSITDDPAFDELRSDLLDRNANQNNAIDQLIQEDTKHQIDINQLFERIDSNTSLLTQLMSKDIADAATVQGAIDAINQTNAAQQEQIETFATTDELNAAVAEIEGREHLYARKSGATFTGGLVIEHNDLSEIGIDFSSSLANSIDAIKVKSFGDEIATFGATQEPHQLAYTITGNQELSVIHDDVKQLSITSDGVHSRELKIVDFRNNDDTGMKAVNVIDVKERLNNYQTAFEEIKKSAILSETFDDFKLRLAEILCDF